MDEKKMLEEQAKDEPIASSDDKDIPSQDPHPVIGGDDGDC